MPTARGRTRSPGGRPASGPRRPTSRPRIPTSRAGTAERRPSWRPGPQPAHGHRWCRTSTRGRPVPVRRHRHQAPGRTAGSASITPYAPHRPVSCGQQPPASWAVGDVTSSRDAPVVAPPHGGDMQPRARPCSRTAATGGSDDEASRAMPPCEALGLRTRPRGPVTLRASGVKSCAVGRWSCCRPPG